MIQRIRTGGAIPWLPLAALPACALLACLASPCRAAADDLRRDVLIDSGWKSAEDDADQNRYAGFEKTDFDDRAWAAVDVPHNWDDYGGYRQLVHGNRHGYAWYRRQFTLDAADRGRRVFLFFEGAGAYATVWVNGKPAGHHAGALTTFTLDVTDLVTFDGANVLAVRADSPAGINDLPWVCGGCQPIPGFSEGSEPFGINRPVHVITTAPVRVEPFGVHAWNGNDVSAESATVHLETEVKNYDAKPRQVRVVSRLLEKGDKPVAETPTEERTLQPGASETIRQDLPAVTRPHLWSPDDPYLYTIRTEVLDNGAAIDRVDTRYGMRWISWPNPDGSDKRPLLVNGKPVFINGTAEYQHMLGGSHAFAPEQVLARVRQFEAAGFNAFRDAHQPHDLRYSQHWDEDGVLWWPQFSANIYFDTDDFRNNFKALLKDWIKERRNSPSAVLWGLQNESRLPKEFAEECSQLIRDLDPTASSQRKIVTCNHGPGTDWSVPQQWSGTYGGNPADYAKDILKAVLVGEYGGWRAIDQHTEGGFMREGLLSEDRFAGLLELKLGLAESVRDQCCGQFLWILVSHDNPGRDVDLRIGRQREGYRELDQLGPVNNKGLFTTWGEPVDAYYMYRSNYTPAATQPMVYIVSHTWPNRWPTPGKRSGIFVYSNCEEVELFNDVKDVSLGTRKRGGRGGKGTHFQWDDVDVRYNVLYAEGKVGGKVVATDRIRLHNLPEAPHAGALKGDKALTAAEPGQNYLYRVNCGGPDYVDCNGNAWMADRTLASAGEAWGSVSWAAEFPELPPDFGSKRKIYDPVAGTADAPLFQTYRFGRHKLRYVFSVPDGQYRVELYFVEPWYGAGGGLDCTGWRLFDVAVNGSTVLKDLDLWKEAGHDHALKKVVTASAANGKLEVSFPRVAAGQAVISAIAIATADASARPPKMPDPLVKDLVVLDQAHADAFSVRSCLDAGDVLYGDAPVTVAELPNELVESRWVRTADASRAFRGPELLKFTVTGGAEVYVAHDRRITSKPSWLAAWEDIGQELVDNEPTPVHFGLYRKHAAAGETVAVGENDSSASAADARMYTVLVKPERPIVPARLIKDLTVNGAPAGGGWRALGALRVGDRAYGDAAPVIAQLPGNLPGCDWVRPPHDPGADLKASFTLAGWAEVFIALDARIESRPRWMAGWTDTKLSLTTSDGKFKVYSKRCDPAFPITLGPNDKLPSGEPAAMYLVFVKHAKPSTVYEAEAAETAGTTLAEGQRGATGRGAVAFGDAAGGYVEWTIATGVADVYNLKFRYAAEAPKGAKAVKARVTVTGADGTVLRTADISFPPTAAAAAGKPPKWGAASTTTGVSINAGTYKVRLSKTGPGALNVDSLEVE